MSAVSPRVCNASRSTCRTVASGREGKWCMRKSFGNRCYLLHIGRRSWHDRDSEACVSLSGRVFGEFVVDQRLKRGGQGEVYLAEQQLLARQVVIKVIRTIAATDAASVERFKREALMASRVDHPFVAHVYSFGVESDGILWIAMELVRGETLAEYMDRYGAIPTARFIPLLERICQVLHSLHEQGIIHRDLKPENIMVMERAGHLLPKLLDLGIAKSLAPADAANWLSKATDVRERGFEHATLDSTGAFIGSPRYMAPEQWITPDNVDARTDLYALGALAFECLAGRPLFTSHTLYELAHAHARSAVPRLEISALKPVQHVLEKALAKRPDDRYSDVLEFVVHLRHAAGLTEIFESARLDPELGRRFASAAPQPVAEAVALFEAARNPEQARDALDWIAQAVTRYMGLVTLIASRHVFDTEVHAYVRDFLDELHHRDLQPSEWLELSHRLVRVLDDEGTHLPIPELERFLRDDARHMVEILESSSGLGQSYTGRLATSSDLIALRFDDSVATIDALLRAVSFVCDYPLVVARVDHAESWTGIRRTARVPLMLEQPAVPDERVFVVDRRRRPIMCLWPLVQIRPPMPGADDELFSFAGRGLQGACFISEPTGYQYTDDSVWSFLGDDSRFIDEPSERELDEQYAPFRGLRAFTRKHHHIFIGRERETEIALNRLRKRPLLCVVGPSGAGKSSFVQAGLLPAFGAEWHSLILRPGPNPLASLQARLERDGVTETTLGDMVSTPPEQLGSILRGLVTIHRRGIILVIDQFEELFTLGSSSEQQLRFAELLVHAVRSPDDDIRVLLTLRDDFLMQAETLAPLRALLTHSVQLLGTPKRPELKRILEEPVRRVGYAFENTAILREMIEGVADRPGALAFLSFTAEQLWKRRNRERKVLTLASYLAMGGVAGALAKHADETVDSLPIDEHSLVRDIFHHLITPQGTRVVYGRNELIQVLGNAHRTRPVLEKLIHARLLVSSEGESGEDRVEIAHEALIQAWPRLVEWQSQDINRRRLRDQLHTAAQQWNERDRTKALLWRGEVLEELASWRVRFSGMLTQREQEFVQASFADAQRLRRIWRLGVVIAVSVVLMAIALPLWVRHRARDAQTAREASVLEDRGRSQLLDGDPLGALDLLREAKKLGARSGRLDTMLALAKQGLEPEYAILDQHTSRVSQAKFSPDGSFVLTVGGKSDPTAMLWRVDTKQPYATLGEHRAVIRSAGFSPDGERVFTASWDGTIRIWNVHSGVRERVLHVNRARVANGCFTPNSAQLVLGWESGSVDIWNVVSGELWMTLQTEGMNAFVACGPTGEHIATASTKGVQLWSLFSGALLRDAHSAGARIITFDDNATHLLWVPERSEIAYVWDLDSDRRVELAEHRGEIASIRVSPTGVHVVTASTDRTAMIWELHTGKRIATLSGHTGPVMSAAFNPDGRYVLTASADRSARTWDASTGHELVRLLGHRDRVTSARFSPDGAFAVTASIDKTARIWKTRAGGLRWYRKHRVGEDTHIVFSPDRSHLAVVTHSGVQVRDAQTGTPQPLVSRVPSRREDIDRMQRGGHGIGSVSGSRGLVAIPRGHVVELVDTRTGRTRLLPDEQSEEHAETINASIFSHDGERLVTASADDTVRIWDIASGVSLQTLRGHIGSVRYAEFDLSGSRVVSASLDKSVRIWDVATGAPIAILSGHTESVEAARFTADGRKIITASHDTTVRIWDASTYEQEVELDGDVRWHGVDIDGSRERVATIDDDGRVVLWDIFSRQQIGIFGLERSKGAWLSFNASGRALGAIMVNRDAYMWSIDGTRDLWDDE